MNLNRGGGLGVAGVGGVGGVEGCCQYRCALSCQPVNTPDRTDYC